MNSKTILWLGILISTIFIVVCIVTKLDQVNPTLTNTIVDIETEKEPLFIEEPVESIVIKEKNNTNKQPKVLPIKQNEQNLSKDIQILLESKSISFQKESAKLLDDGKAALDEVIKLIKDPNDIILYISGHTDAKGDPKLNTLLSQQRADSVKEYLIEKGIKTKIISKGYGSSKPITDNKYDTKNRRVEITLQKDTQ